MHTLAEIEGPLRTPPGGALLTQQIQIFHDKHPLPEINRMEIESIVVPSMMLLRALDIGGQHRTAELFYTKEQFGYRGTRLIVNESLIV
jgi:hypothetical protein